MEFSGLHCCLFVKVPKVSLRDTLQISLCDIFDCVAVLGDNSVIISQLKTHVNNFFKNFLKSHSQQYNC